MEIINWFASHMQNVILLLEKYQFLGVNLHVLLVSFILISMVISIFWRGARG